MKKIEYGYCPVLEREVGIVIEYDIRKAVGVKPQIKFGKYKCEHDDKSNQTCSNCPLFNEIIHRAP